MNRHRHLTILEVFLLALVEKAGMNTIYALQSVPGLTWGGIRPSLHRLERWNLISRAETGKFGRRQFCVTKEGKKSLRGGWPRRIMDEASADLETVTRAAWLGWVLDPGAASRFLHRASQQRRQAAEQLNAAPLSSGPPTSPLDLYVWLRSLCRVKQLHAEADALDLLRQRLREEDEGQWGVIRRGWEKEEKEST